MQTITYSLLSVVIAARKSQIREASVTDPPWGRAAEVLNFRQPLGELGAVNTWGRWQSVARHAVKALHNKETLHYKSTTQEGDFAY